METKPRRTRHFLSQALWLFLPLVAAAAGLAAFGLIGWVSALGFAAVVIALQAVWLVRALRALGATAEIVQRDVESADAGGDDVIERARHFPPAEDIIRALARSRREALRRHEGDTGDTTLGHLLAALPQPILLLGATRQILRANPAVARLFGTSAEGRDVTALLRDAELLDAVDAALADGTAREVDFRMHLPTERDLRAHLRPLGAAGHDAVLLVTIDDLTSQRRTDVMRSDFVANVSHELRTPLSSLIGFIETLRGPASEDAGARERFLEIMEEQASRMARLIEDLTSLSRIEMEEHRPPTEAVDIVPSLQALVEALQPQAARRRIRFRLRLPEPGAGPVPRVVGDADQLYQVFQNLLTNALKYGAEKTTVTLTVDPAAEFPEDAQPASRRGETNPLLRVTALHAPEHGPYLCVSVADEGEGIPEDHLGRLTERFYRVDSARSRALGGTGLGLAIVKHILARHRGGLQIESAPGRGSTFSVFLPCADAAGAGETPDLAAQ